MKDTACKTCGCSPADQHLLSQSGICDGLRTGKLVRLPDGRIAKATPKE